jgi:predicted Zn-dependent protease
MRGQAQRDPAFVSRPEGAANAKAPSPLRSADALHGDLGGARFMGREEVLWEQESSYEPLGRAALPCIRTSVNAATPQHCPTPVAAALNGARLLSTIPPAAPPTTNKLTGVDVMVEYTAESRVGAGGKESIESLINLATAEANTVYQNSQADVRLRLVHLREIDYAEFPNNATNLNRLQSRSDSFLDEIHLIRQTNRADLVCLITEHSDPGTSGLAFTMGAPSFAFRDSAFSIVKRADLVGSFIFVHEISHNFGAQHDREHALDGEGKLKPGSYPFSFGYRFVLIDTVYRDVMSYAPGEPIPYLSNPDISFLGMPIGLPGTTNGANNALTANANALLVADFFGPEVQTLPPAIQMLAPTNGTILREGTNLVITAQGSDPDGAIRRIDFYRANTLLGVMTNAAPVMATNDFSIV